MATNSQSLVERMGRFITNEADRHASIARSDELEGPEGQEITEQSVLFFRGVKPSWIDGGKPRSSPPQAGLKFYQTSTAFIGS